MTWAGKLFVGQMLAVLFAIGLSVYVLMVVNATTQSRFPTGPGKYLTGVNLSGGALGGDQLPGTYMQHYVYPDTSTIDYYVSKGLHIFRIGFLTARLLPSIEDPTGTLTDAAIVDELITYADTRGAYIILDMHEYARNSAGLIGKDSKATELFATSWRKIAERYRDKPNLIFGLMNEPNIQSAREWLRGANAGIAAIRAAGAKQLILVPGSYWSGAYKWTTTDNGKVMLGIRDPIDNYVFEVHQYFDQNSAGMSPDIVPGSGAARLAVFTAWARAHKKRGFLGEFGWAATDEGQREGEAALAHMSENRDVWLGWTYWAGGPWWGEYMFTVEPKEGVDRPQMKLLEKYAHP